MHSYPVIQEERAMYEQLFFQLYCWSLPTGRYYLKEKKSHQQMALLTLQRFTYILKKEISPLFWSNKTTSGNKRRRAKDEIDTKLANSRLN